MKKSIINISVFALLILFTNCKENKFTNVLEIEIPEQESILAVTTHLNANQRVVEALISQTLGALEEPDSFSTFFDASVRLFENGNLLGEFNYDTDILKHTNSLDFPIKEEAGIVYRMEVDAPNFESVWAEQTMPSKASIISVDYTPRGTINFDGDESDELIIEIEDIANEANFYNFSAQVEIKFRIQGDTTVYTTGDMLYLDTLDPLVEFGPDGNLLLNDRNFDGDNYKARFFFWPFDNWISGNEVEIVSSRLFIQVGSMTNDKYLYEKTLDAFRINRDNPFSEPVTVHHNFENGTGVFTLENTSFFILDL